MHATGLVYIIDDTSLSCLPPLPQSATLSMTVIFYTLYTCPLLDHNPGAVAATKVKLVRKTHTDERMEVDSDECRQSSVNSQGSFTDATTS